MRSWSPSLSLLSSLTLWSWTTVTWPCLLLPLFSAEVRWRSCPLGTQEDVACIQKKYFNFSTWQMKVLFYFMWSSLLIWIVKWKFQCTWTNILVAALCWSVKHWKVFLFSDCKNETLQFLSFASRGISVWTARLLANPLFFSSWPCDRYCW